LFRQFRHVGQVTRLLYQGLLGCAQQLFGVLQLGLDQVLLLREHANVHLLHEDDFRELRQLRKLSFCG
jgi:hypothetical protein